MPMLARYIARFSLMLFLSMGFAVTAQEDVLPPQSTAYDWQFDDTDRHFQLYIPENLSDDTPVPLLFALHGSGDTGAKMEIMTGGRFNELADENGFIVVYPDGIDNQWNDARRIRPDLASRAYLDNVDDVGFITALIDHVETISAYPIDREKIYVVGFSNGGHMAFRLACEASDIFAGVGTVAAQLAEGTQALCDQPTPTSMLMIFGSEDPFIPFEGAETPRGHYIGLNETVDFWVETMDCTASPQSGTLPDTVPTDSLETSYLQYDTCADDTRFSIYTVEGGGHTWPGAEQFEPLEQWGLTTSDFYATDLFWEFFSGVE